MDTVTQGLLGAVAAQATFGPRLGKRAWVAGAVGGIFADLDPVLAPLSDAAFPIEYHRHLTHAFAFLPLGAMMACALLLPFAGYRRRLLPVLGAVFVGYLTHAPLDLCTSYGTLVFWPFSRARPAWDLISVVDPIFTLLLVVGLVFAVRKGSRRIAALTLLLCVGYLGVGLLQRERAAEVQRTLAEARGHVVEHGRVMPTLGNLIVWRSVYVQGERIYADHVRVPPFHAAASRAGGSVARYRPRDLPSDVPDHARLADVFGRFHHFADGFTARTPGDATVIGDMRYSMGPGFDPIWGMRIEPARGPRWAQRFRERREALGQLAAAVFAGRAFRPVNHPP